MKRRTFVKLTGAAAELKNNSFIRQSYLGL